MLLPGTGSYDNQGNHQIEKPRVENCEGLLAIAAGSLGLWTSNLLWGGYISEASLLQYSFVYLDPQNSNSEMVLATQSSG